MQKLAQYTRLFTHELLDGGTPSGIHFGTDNFDVVKKSHVDGETSTKISVWCSQTELEQLEKEIQELKKAKAELLEALYAPTKTLQSARIC